MSRDEPTVPADRVLALGNALVNLAVHNGAGRPGKDGTVLLSSIDYALGRFDVVARPPEPVKPDHTARNLARVTEVGVLSEVGLGLELEPFVWAGLDVVLRQCNGVNGCGAILTEDAGEAHARHHHRLQDVRDALPAVWE